MTAAIRPLLNWTPPGTLEEGYSIVVGCMHKLAPVAAANMRLIANTRSQRLKEVLLVFDCTEEELPAQIPKLKDELDWPCDVRILTYSDKQAQVARRINWGWVYSWLSWSIGIENCRSQHLILHDLDALPLDPTLFDRLYDAALENKTIFHGIRPYEGHFIRAEDGLVTTFELVFQPGVLRERFQPIDAFNRVGTIDGRYIDFDTLLWIQRQLRSSSVRRIDEEELVHPSQLICNYTDYVSGRNSMASMRHNLVLMPYFQYLGGEEAALQAPTEALSDTASDNIPLFGRSLPIGHLQAEHWAWTEKQIRRVEQSLYGATRPEVEQFLGGIVARAGTQRTVGQETSGVPVL